MRLLAVLVMLAPLGACDLQPPPKQKEKPAPAANTEQPGSAAPAPGTPPAAATPPTPPTPPTPAAPPPDAGAPAPDAFDVTQQCLDVSAHIAAVLIEEQKDPTARAALEQDKTKIIRRAAEGCTRDVWPLTAIQCFMKAGTVAAMEICGKDLKAP